MMTRYLIPLSAMLLVGSLASAKRAAPPPLMLRVPVVDAVVLGKVTGFGEKLVPAEMFKGDTSEMQVARVKVDEVLQGRAGPKEIQVGFFPSPGRGARNPIPAVEVNEECCFFLTRHPTRANLYILRNWYDVHSKKDSSDFTKEMQEVRKTVKLLANPAASLASRDAEERYLTAALLITQYRTMRTGTEKLQAIPAAESKQILTILAEADWAGTNPRQAIGLAPRGLFFRLGITEKDGWKPPQDFSKLSDEAKKWLRDNAGTYRLKKFVPADRVEPDPEPSR
ncbi:MAG: hypothetical protein U0840_16635 [Gemmataceae bacterium]